LLPGSCAICERRARPSFACFTSKVSVGPPPIEVGRPTSGQAKSKALSRNDRLLASYGVGRPPPGINVPSGRFVTIGPQSPYQLRPR
jgi:hypothetical protein